eukprot:m.109780 g.109780  ORF g.109780 m.109780 type:complete len:66 (+) comp13381_c0_seq1:117-314(+)
MSAYKFCDLLVGFLFLSFFCSVPSIREMQGALAASGQYPSNLVGSTEWLGSMDLGSILQTEYNVQ